MWRLVFIVPIIGLWPLLSLGQVYACSCAETGSPSEELESSAAVFMGKVTSVQEYVRDDGTWATNDPTTVEFAVSTVWKGPPHKLISLTTPRSGASCGFGFVAGEEYIVYSEPNGRTVSLCSRTRLLSEAQRDLAELGPGQQPTIMPTPEPAPSTSVVWSLWAVAIPAVAVLMGLTGAALWLGLGRKGSW